MEKFIIVVFCYKKDYFMTRPCVASIRYFYPQAEIYLLKDYLAGDFDSQELEKAFDVKELDLGIRNYGWSAAKVHFLLSKQFVGQRVLTLDCDIVFAGRFLEDLYRKTEGIDFVVDPEYYASPYEGNVPLHYYKFDDVKLFDPSFEFPGYVFNGGQMLVKTDKIPVDYITPLFDAVTFPYYKRRDILPQVDQSLLNYLLPKLAKEGKLTLGAENFMAWSNGQEALNVNLAKLKEGETYPFLIHWAGVLRVADFSLMTRADILLFFENYYYSKVPLGTIKKKARRAIATSDFHLRKFYRNTVKPLLGK
jgi:hypothetical protein